MPSKRSEIINLLEVERDVDIARKFGVSRQYINQIRRDKKLPRVNWMPDVDSKYLKVTPSSEVMEKYGLTYYKYLKLKKTKGV
jgi:hypothetical protein